MTESHWLANEWEDDTEVIVYFTDEDGCCHRNKISPRENLLEDGYEREVETVDYLFGLIKRVVSSPPGWRGSGRTRWSCVGSAFSVGSTHATKLCRQFGLDPDEVC